MILDAPATRTPTNAVPDDVSAFFATAILKARSDRSMTQVEFAKLCGVSQPAVVKWESGSRQLTGATLAKVARALHIPVGVLLYPLSRDAWRLHRKQKPKRKGARPHAKRSS